MPLLALAFSADLAVGLALGLAVGAGAAGAVVRRRLRAHLAAAQAALARHRDPVAQAPDVLLVHDVDGGRLEANRAAQAALGLGDAQPQLAFLDAVAVADRAAARRHLAALDADGQACTDLHLVGGGRLLEVVSGVVSVAGQRRAISIGRDVGARRDRERELAEARDLAEEAARVRSQFLASLSHEIRTPLTSVLGFTELLREEVGEAQRGLVEAIEAGGHRLLATLDSVLDLATLDARRETLRPATLDVVAAVEAAVERHRPDAEARGLALEVQAFEPVTWATLDADALCRILAHVVGNAVRYTETGHVTVEIDADAEAIGIRVIDTGIGIADDALPHLFEGFQNPGQGFGLAITHRIVKLMGGTINVESRWRAGTAVTVVLPRGDASPAVDAPQAEALVEAG